MTDAVETQMDGLGLVAEVERYLAAVDAFRAAGREPRWLPEPGSEAGAPPSRRRVRRVGNTTGGIA